MQQWLNPVKYLKVVIHVAYPGDSLIPIKNIYENFISFYVTIILNSYLGTVSSM